MTADTIKKGIRKALKKKDIIVNRIAFHGVIKKEKDVDGIMKMTLTLDSIGGVELDRLKMAVDDYLDECNINYYGILLDI